MGLNATPANSNIGLIWNSSVDATNYNLKRSTTSGGPYTTLVTTSSTNYTDSSVAIGPIYYYVVSAVDSFGESTNSSQASATISPAHPVIAATAFKGGSMVLSGSGGLSNSPYYVLSSTNLTLPVAQWAAIATNTFDNNGDFSFTNAPDPSIPEVFYLLETP